MPSKPRTRLRIRPEAHEVDTLARRRVPDALPAAWEHREMTGRDYGIDMMVELFDSAASTGSFLLLQIKGTQAAVESDVHSLAFDVPVGNLRYAELFAVPVLLAVCPVTANPPRFYYLWMQEYIRVVLNMDNATWRQNKATVRVEIPTMNLMPTSENHLAFIASFPQRLFGWTQVARILHELHFLFKEVPENINLRAVLRCLNEMKEIPSLFQQPKDRWLDLVKSHGLEAPIRVAELLLRGGPYTIEEIESLGLGVNRDEVTVSDQFWLDGILRTNLALSADSISAFLATANDNGLARAQWEMHRGHDF